MDGSVVVLLVFCFIVGECVNGVDEVVGSVDGSVVAVVFVDFSEIVVVVDFIVSGSVLTFCIILVVSVGDVNFSVCGVSEMGVVCERRSVVVVGGDFVDIVVVDRLDVCVVCGMVKDVVGE